MHFVPGHVSESKPGYARVAFPGESGIVSDWLPVAVPFSMTDKVCWQLPIQTQVMCCMGPHLDEGVIIGATYNEEDTAPEGVSENVFKILFEDGTEIKYDKTAHELTATFGTVVYKWNRNGFLQQKGSDTLKQILVLITEAVQQVVVLYGNNPDYTKLTQALTKINNILE